MTLLETTYADLRNAGLVHCAEAFSSDYLGKNRNWFSYQKHTGRDFSIDAAIQCLRKIRTLQRLVTLRPAQNAALSAIEQQLLAHLSTKYCVADVC